MEKYEYLKQFSQYKNVFEMDKYDRYIFEPENKEPAEFGVIQVPKSEEAEVEFYYNSSTKETPRWFTDIIESVKEKDHIKFGIKRVVRNIEAK